MGQGIIIRIYLELFLSIVLEKVRKGLNNFSNSMAQSANYLMILTTTTCLSCYPLIPPGNHCRRAVNEL